MAAPTPLLDASCPLVLIAEPNRSGGTLLAQLLDGHPELHSHPPELKVGQSWPVLDLSLPPRALYAEIQEPHLGRAFREGYSKDKPAQRVGLQGQLQSFPFDLDPKAHRRLFMELMAREPPPRNTREVLDRYFTALFSAWPGNANREGRKRWTVAFRGRLRYQLDPFFVDYPDGRHIACVRDPKARAASAIRYGGQDRRPIDYYIDIWRQGVAIARGAQGRYGDRVLVLTYEDMVLETEATMRALAAWLGIGFDPILLQPTFNRAPIRASSSFPVSADGVIREPLDHWRDVLTPEEADEVDRRCADLYAEVRGRLSVSPAADQPGASTP